MVLDGVLGDPKGRANLLVRRPCRHQLQDLQLPGAELLFRTGLLTVGPGHTGELVENLGGRRPGDWGLPLKDPAENPQEGFWLDLLLEVPVRPRLDGIEEVLVLLRDREHDDLHVGEDLLDPMGGLHAGHPRHVDVHQDEVRHQLLGLLQGLVAIVRLSHHLKVPSPTQEPGHSGAEQGMVIDQENPYRFHEATSCPSIGSLTISDVPFPC